MIQVIRAAKVIDPNSKYNGKTVDILLEDGVITEINASISSNFDEEIKFDNYCVSPGWFDMHVNFRDPGLEYKEGLENGCAAAAKGGMTGVLLMPSTTPPVDNKASVDYIISKTKTNAVDVFPAGCVTQQRKGEELSEMYDMATAGAVAFTDDKRPIAHAGIMERALLYTQNFDSLVMSFPNDKQISSDGKMNEGITSTQLGLKGMPALAEELQTARDIKLAEYCEAPLHFTGITTKGSVASIQQAQKDGLNITAETYAHHLLLDDSLLNTFDTNYKVNPPLRGKEDITALVKAIKNGTISIISSDHSPEDVEHKIVEFDNASFGITGTETLFSVTNTALKDSLSTEEIVTILAINPRKLLKLAVPSIQEGEQANLTFFNPDKEWTLSESDLLSKGKNSPFIGTTFTGKALGIYNNGKLG